MDQALPTGCRRWPRRLASGWGRAVFVWLMVLLVGFGPVPAVQAAELELVNFELTAADDGLMLTYAVNFDLSRGVDDALNKAVPLFFVAEAQVFRSRWYWRDQRVAQAVRVWRIVYQPLTSTYRVTFGGLSQNYGSRAEALAAISRGVRWKIADLGQIDSASGGHYVEFSYRLDTSLLPRPMQIGIDGQPDWELAVERTQRIN